MSQIINALKQIKNRCDGAHSKDYAGFNQPDVFISSYIITIADNNKLTNEIEWMAWKLLKKYKKQLADIGIDYKAFEEPKIELTEDTENDVKENIKHKANEIKSKIKNIALEEQSKNGFNVVVENDYLRCFFPYSPSIVDAIKQIPQSRYDASNPSWSFPIRTKSLVAFKEKVETLGLKIENKEVLDILNRAESFKDNVNTATLENQTIFFKFDFDYTLINLIKSIPCARWSQERKIWSAVISIESVESIKEVLKNGKFSFDENIEKIIESYKEKFNNNLTDSLKQESDLVVEGLTGNLKPFQKAGVEYLTKNTSAILADEMGLGKTIQAIATVQHNKAYPVLIVCPASLKLNWYQEIRKWLPDRKVEIFNNGVNPQIDFTIINYEQLKKLNDIKITTIIFDEAHRLKNHKAKRTQAAIELAKKAKFKYLLSGTPMLNRPKELISQLTILDKLEEFGGFWTFVTKYCDAKRTEYGLILDGATNLTELKTNLRKICLIRREKSDVLPELPEKQRSYIPFNISNEKEYKQAERDLISFVKNRAKNDAKFKKELVSKNLSQEEIEQAIKERTSSAEEKVLRAETLVRINTLRKLAATGKIESATEWLLDFADTGKKLVIFVHHKEILNQVCAILKEAGIELVSICGDNSEEDRANSIQRFQNDPKCQMIVCTLQTGGEGITLTAASDVAFLEVGWKPSELDQAEDRCHRIGQKNAVNAYFFKAENTIDDMIYDMIEAKRDITNVNKSSIMDDVINTIINKSRAKS